MPARDTRTGLQVIDRDECLELLGQRQVGRLAVVIGRSPIVLPVNYAMLGADIVFRTDAGTKLLAAERAPVAFEIDEIDEASHRGWSVLVSGHAEEITPYDTSSVRELTSLPLHPWAGGAKDHWVRIVAETITGRRI